MRIQLTKHGWPFAADRQLIELAKSSKSLTDISAIMNRDVKAVQKVLGVEKAGHLVEDALASIARKLRDAGVRKFVVAGGETSGAVVQALDVRSLRIGPQIDPGVPATQSIGRPGDMPLALALKSGNFGATDFFAKALKVL